jgi:hypothetical protein
MTHDVKGGVKNDHHNKASSEITKRSTIRKRYIDLLVKQMASEATFHKGAGVGALERPTLS